MEREREIHSNSANAIDNGNNAVVACPRDIVLRQYAVMDHHDSGSDAGGLGVGEARA